MFNLTSSLMKLFSPSIFPHYKQIKVNQVKIRSK